MRSIIFVIIIWFLPITVKADDFDFNQQIEQEFFTVLNALRQRAYASGETRTTALLEYPTISIDWYSPLPGAVAIHGVGEPSVIVSSEFVKLLYFFAELSVLSTSDESISEEIIKCKTEYQEHIRDQVFLVLEGQSISGTHSTYDSPEEYATIGFQCRNIGRFFPLHSSLKPRRDSLVRNGIGFVIMHEIGHILLEHKVSARADEIRQSILCQSRKQEREADSFAVQKLVNYGYGDAVVQNSFWDVGVAVGTIVPKEVAASTHPSPTQRMSDSINQAIREARNLGASPDPKLVDLAQQLVALQRRIERELSDDDLTINTGGC